MENVLGGVRPVNEVQTNRETHPDNGEPSQVGHPGRPAAATVGVTGVTGGAGLMKNHTTPPGWRTSHPNHSHRNPSVTPEVSHPER